MRLALKTQNQPLLATLLLWNFGVLYLALAFKTHDWTQMISLGAQWQQALLPAGVVILLVGILTEQFSPQWKARIVFWKWRNPLPASRAFTVLGPDDPRIDMADLENRCGPFPVEPAEQNRVWYKLFKSVESQPTILALHKRYLLYRDYACLSLLVLVIAIPLVLWERLSGAQAITFAAFFFIQYLLVRNAAKLAGRRFVTTVMSNC
jgi:hypothetical protein